MPEELILLIYSSGLFERKTKQFCGLVAE